MSAYAMNTGNDWDRVLADEFEKDYFKELTAFLDSEYENHEVYPPRPDIFNALRYSSFEDTRVVILGQDPYHEPGQAHGLCFSVNKGVRIPPSLVNIYEELKNDTGITPPSHGYLADWAKQGVLLLNTVLTVRRGEANSHRNRGWETFTDSVVKSLNDKKTPVVFLLWGANAAAKQDIITNREHMILTGAHPSPLSAYKGFFGGRYFSRANRFLELTGREPIDWRL